MSLGVYAAAGAVLLVLLRCALAQKRGVRCFLAGSVCGLGALALSRTPYGPPCLTICGSSRVSSSSPGITMP